MNKYIEILDIDGNLLKTEGLELTEYFLHNSITKQIESFSDVNFDIIKKKGDIGIGKMYQYTTSTFKNYNDDSKLNITTEYCIANNLLGPASLYLKETLNKKNSSIHVLTGRGQKSEEIKESIIKISKTILKDSYNHKIHGQKIEGGKFIGINSQSFIEKNKITNESSSLKKIIGIKEIIDFELGKAQTNDQIYIRYSDDLEIIIQEVGSFIKNEILKKIKYKTIKKIDLILTNSSNTNQITEFLI